MKDYFKRMSQYFKKEEQERKVLTKEEKRMRAFYRLYKAGIIDEHGNLNEIYREDNKE